MFRRHILYGFKTLKFTETFSFSPGIWLISMDRPCTFESDVNSAEDLMVFSRCWLGQVDNGFPQTSASLVILHACVLILSVTEKGRFKSPTMIGACLVFSWAVVQVRVFQRNRTNRIYIDIYRYIYRNWVLWLWRLRSTRICDLQAGEPGELRANSQSEG